MKGDTAMANEQYQLTWKIRRLFKLLAEMSDQYLEPAGISVQERAVVEYLDNWGAAPVPRIARLFYVSRQNIQIRINGLMKKGWVEKRKNPDHAKSDLITLTEKGSREFKKIRSHETVLLATIFSGIDDTHIATTFKTLTQLGGNIQRQLEKDKK